MQKANRLILVFVLALGTGCARKTSGEIVICMPPSSAKGVEVNSLNTLLEIMRSKRIWAKALESRSDILASGNLTDIALQPERYMSIKRVRASKSSAGRDELVFELQFRDLTSDKAEALIKSMAQAYVEYMNTPIGPDLATVIQFLRQALDKLESERPGPGCSEEQMKAWSERYGILKRRLEDACSELPPTEAVSVQCARLL